MVDVDPVGRGLLALALGLEVALDEREAPGAGLAHHIHVVTRARHGHAELQGLDSTLLAQDSAKRLQIVGMGKGKLLGGETPGQGFRRKTQARSDRIGHWVSLLRRGRYAAFWRCPRAPCKAPRDFMSQPVQSCDSKFFAINNATFRSCLNSKLRGWVKRFPDLATELPETLTLG
ncbi:hypothetical protein D3C79_823150 [compost metagenome]